MKIREKYTCPLEIAHDSIKGKWKPIILWQLSKQAMQQPCKLQNSIQGINQKMLFEQLNELQNVGMIFKDAEQGFPLCTRYSLTLRGKKMLEAITILQEIGSEMLQE